MYGVMKRENNIMYGGSVCTFKAGSIWRITQSSNLEVMAEEVGDDTRLFFHRQEINDYFILTESISHAIDESTRIEGEYYLLQG